MKKIIIFSTIIGVLLCSVFAEDESFNEKRNFAFNTGIQLSVLGLAPTFTFDFNKFEIQTKIAVNQDIDSNVFGFAPQIALGYNSNPYGTGYSNFIGGTYYFITNNWVKTFINSSSNNRILLNLIGVAYQGSVRWNSGFGISWGATLPLAVLGIDENVHFFAIYQNPAMFMIFNGLGFFTSHFGVSYRF